MAELNGLSGLDALSGEAAEVTAPAVNVGDSATAAKEKFAEVGKAIYRNLSTDQKNELNSNSDKVSMITLLCADSQPTMRTENGQTTPSSAVVGMKLRTEIDLDVPVIPFQKAPHDLKSIPDIATLQYRHVAAGSEFVLNRVEAMYLITLPQYKLNGYCSYNGEAKAVQLAAKLSKTYTNGGLPTPAFKFTDSEKGSIKTNMESVEVNNNGTWELKPEYAEAFADLRVVRAGGRTTDGMPASKAQQGVLASLAIYSILSGGKK